MCPEVGCAGVRAGAVLGGDCCHEGPLLGEEERKYLVNSTSGKRQDPQVEGADGGGFPKVRGRGDEGTVGPEGLGQAPGAERAAWAASGCH